VRGSGLAGVADPLRRRRIAPTAGFRTLVRTMRRSPPHPLPVALLCQGPAYAAIAAFVPFPLGMLCSNISADIQKGY
jgi:hypothetical protein